MLRRSRGALRSFRPKGSFTRQRPAEDLYVTHKPGEAEATKQREAVQQRLEEWKTLSPGRKILRRLGLFTKVFGGAFALYLGSCIAFTAWISKGIDESHRPKEDGNLLTKWDEIEPQLRAGDIVLMYGTGPISWQIVNGQVAYSGGMAVAARYSHVGVIVEPAAKDGSHGALMLEAVDNKDVNCEDYKGDIRHNQVQLVEAKKRIFGREGTRRCYSRCAVRLQQEDFVWGKKLTERSRAFVEKSIGQPMDKSALMALNYIYPPLYNWTGAREKQHAEFWEKLKKEKGPDALDPGPVISCSELLVLYFSALGTLDGDRIETPSAVAPFQLGDVNYNYMKLPWIVPHDREIKIELPQE